ncbi:MAG: LuxR C-terminal-related transcriptional regulator, partial [Thermodesulfobacteriota bacterium]
ICSFVDISERKKAEEELSKAKEELEIKVAERTESLVEANEQLKREIEERKQIEEQLREKENELQQKADHMEEVNTALKVLLKRREEDKEELEEKVVSNVKELIMPYIEELGETRLDSKQRGFLNVIASNLENIVSPFAKNLTSRNLDFTPTQLQIAELIKSGKSTKDIAEIMETTDRAVEFHRNNIRDKLGLKHKKINLRTYLLSYS